MPSTLPRLTGYSKSTDGAEFASSRHSHPPQPEARRPSDLKVGQLNLEQSDDEDFPPQKQLSYSDLSIPSPTYRIMFTPEFLIHSHDSADDYSDGLSSSDVEDVEASNNAFNIFPPWSSRAEHVKPLVNRFISEDTRRQNSVRLAWRSTLAATYTDTYGSSSSGVQLGIDLEETQSSFCFSCHDHILSGMEEGSYTPLRRTKSLADLSTKTSRKTCRQFSTLDSFCISNSEDSYMTKENHIKRWVSDVAIKIKL